MLSARPADQCLPFSLPGAREEGTSGLPSLGSAPWFLPMGTGCSPSNCQAGVGSHSPSIEQSRSEEPTLISHRHFSVQTSKDMAQGPERDEWAANREQFQKGCGFRAAF